MITNLALENFKSWRATGPVRLAPITALFGSNSSGKTSLLQMLLMLKQTADSPDRNQVLNLGDKRSLVELGTYQEVIFRHDVKAPLEMEIDWTLRQEMTVEDPTMHDEILFKDSRLRFAARLRWQANGEQSIGRVAVDEMRYGFDGRDFGMRRSKAKPGYDLFPTSGTFRFKRTKGRPWKLPHPSRCYGFPDQVRGYFQNAGFLSDFELQFEQLFANLFYLGPLREYPQREYSWAGTRPVDVGQRGENVVDALLASREGKPSILLGKGNKRRWLDEHVAHWLKEMGLIESFEVRPVTPRGKLFQVWVRRHNEAAEVLITDVGFGVSQILPVITLCYYAPEGSTIILEQPEIHLHPRVQAALADVIVDASRIRNIQIILESHSEHLLRRLQRRVAEQALAAEQVALYFCVMEAGESKLVPLEMDTFGTIANWPADFFGDEFGEIAATSKAALTRKLRETA